MEKAGDFQYEAFISCRHKEDVFHPNIRNPLRPPDLMKTNFWSFL
jgi:hypothetical protein